MYKNLNPIKRRLFKLITNSFRNSNVPYPKFGDNKKVNVLIIRPNHRLGNQLLISPLIQEVHNQIPHCQIHLLTNGALSTIIFENYEYVTKINELPKRPFENLISYLKTSIKVLSKTYDMAMLGNESSNSGKIFLKLCRARHKVYNSGSFLENKPQHIAKYPIYNFLVNQQGVIESDLINYPKMDIKLSEKEVEEGRKMLSALFNKTEKIIAIFTYATGNKMLSKEWWQAFYLSLKIEFPHHQILEILPKENISQIDFNAVQFYSLDIREIAALIEACSFFVGADSGMMHLAASTNTTTFGLFNVTNPAVYKPYGNDNYSFLTTAFSHFEMITKIKTLV